MKKLFLFVLTIGLLVGCQRFNIGPKGEGEYVIGSATVPYSETAVSAMKRSALRQAEKNALERAVHVFLSSNSNMDYPPAVQREILAKPDNYIRKAYIKTAYRKGDSYYLEARVMVLVSDLATKIKALQDSAYVKKTNIVVASRELINGEISLKQYCRQGVYKALKNFPYTLLDGGNLSQNNIEDTSSIVDKAKKEGARFVVIAEAQAAPLESASQFTTAFTPIRAKVSLKVLATNNYQVIAEAADSFSGLDPVLDIAQQKALSGACDNAAAQVTDQINISINNAKTFQFIVKDVNTIERLERLQGILRQLREVEDFNLVKYTNSNATFDVQANVATSEEFSAKIIRKYYDSFSIMRTGPDLVEMQFL